MSHQDWEPVVLKKKKAPTKAAHGDAAVTQAMRNGGNVETQKKFNAGQNKQHGGPVVDARKLEDEDADVKLKTVSADLKIQISQARQAKGWTQKELAVKINEKPTVVAEYESGKAIVDPKILSKMSRVLEVQLKK